MPVILASGVNTGGKSVRKSNTEIGFHIKSGHLSLLARKLINILIFYAQRLKGKEDNEGKYWVEASRLVKDILIKSKDYDMLRDAMDELQSVRIIRSTASGGITSDVLIPSFTLTNLAHSDNEARPPGQRRRGGQLMLGFSFPVHIRNIILDPRNNYTVLPILYVASLRTMGGLVLYEIAKRYSTNPSGVTNREDWQWWWRVLTGAEPESTPPLYKYFKRDVLKEAIKEINDVTDVEIELSEFKEGRCVKELQFRVGLSRQSSLDMEPPPVDTMLLSRILALGISMLEAERIMQRYSESELADNLAVVEQRANNKTLEPLVSVAAYLKSALKGSYGAGKVALARAKKEQATAQSQQEAVNQAKFDQDQAAAQVVREIKKEAAIEWHDTLSHDEQDELLNTFRSTLVGPLAAQFSKSGFKSKLAHQAWLAWLSEQHNLTLT